MHPFRIASRADVERIESRPYADYMAHASVFDALADAAARHGERPALTFVVDAEMPESTRRWTHREFLADVRRAANTFRALCDGEAPRVALLLPAIPQMYFALWGAETAGVACPINYLLNAEHIAELIERRARTCSSRSGRTPSSTSGRGSRGCASAARGSGASSLSAVRRQAQGADDFDAALAAQDGDALAFDRAHRRRHACRPLPHRRHHRRAQARPAHPRQPAPLGLVARRRCTRSTSTTSIINGFPLFHVAGSLRLRPVDAALGRRAGAADAARHAQRGASCRATGSWSSVIGVTLLAVVPTILATLARRSTDAAPICASVRAAYTGGSPLPTELAARFEARTGIPVRNILGMTECAGVVSHRAAARRRARPAPCGLRAAVHAGARRRCRRLRRRRRRPGVLRAARPARQPRLHRPAPRRRHLRRDGWLVERRPRPRRRGGPPLRHRPRQGRDHPRLAQHRPGPDRGRAAAPSRRRDGRRRRRARRVRRRGAGGLRRR